MAILVFRIRSRGPKITVESNGGEPTMRCTCLTGRERIWPCNDRFKLIAGNLRHFVLPSKSDLDALAEMIGGSKLVSLCTERDRVNAEAEALRAQKKSLWGTSAVDALYERGLALAEERERLNRAIGAAMNGAT